MTNNNQHKTNAKLAWWVVSAAVGIGFGYAAFGVLSLFKMGLGWRLWWLEPVVALAAGLACFWLCGQLATRQQSTPIVSRGERAIWRLAYRRGMVLGLDEVLRETMLEEDAARMALAALEAKGQAVQLDARRWQLLA